MALLFLMKSKAPSSGKTHRGELRRRAHTLPANTSRVWQTHRLKCRFQVNSHVGGKFKVLEVTTYRLELLLCIRTSLKKKLQTKNQARDERLAEAECHLSRFALSKFEVKKI